MTPPNTERELLELAAKAASYDVNFDDGHINGWYAKGYDQNGDVEEWWNPLTDDAAALRLAVKLELGIAVQRTFTEVCDGVMKHCAEKHGDNPCAATRRAIVRTAAEIGRAMP